MDPLDRLRETRLLPVLVGLGLVALGLLLMRVAHILPPFIWAAITAYLLYPLVVRLERRLRVPRVLVIAGLYIVLIGVLVVVAVQVVPTAFEQVREFAKSLPDLITTARQELVRNPQVHIGGFTLDTERINARIDETAQQLAERFGREAVPLVLATVEIALKTLVYLLSTFYFLLQGDAMLRRLRDLAPSRHQPTVDRVTSEVNATFGAYIRAQLILFLIVAGATFVALEVLHVQYALALAIASGALELVPIIGPWMAAGTAMLVALSQGSAPFGWSPIELAAAVGIVYLVIRMVEDHLIIPQLVGRIVRLHPVLVIFGVLAGASLGGALGLLLAVPTLAALKIIVLAVVEEIRHPAVRRVVALREPGTLPLIVSEIKERQREHLVLLVAPGAIGWEDLACAQALATEALRNEVRVQVVTPDPLVASIATAAGLEVITHVRLEQEAELISERPLEPEDLEEEPSAPTARQAVTPLREGDRSTREGQARGAD